MNENTSIITRLLANKYLLFLGAFGLIVFVVLILLPLLSLFTQETEQSPELTSPTPIPRTLQKRDLAKYSSLYKTTVGSTTEKELEETTVVITKTPLSDLRTRYVIDSDLAGRQNEVITRNGVVVFDATPIFTNRFGPLPYAAQYIIEHGKPDAVIKGNKRWGWYTSAYIYAQKGLAFIANHYTSEIYEVIHFLPMSLQEFQATYPEYLETEKPEENEHYQLPPEAQLP